jgi:hypothetical protein
VIPSSQEVTGPHLVKGLHGIFEEVLLGFLGLALRSASVSRSLLQQYRALSWEISGSLAHPRSAKKAAFEYIPVL